MNPLKKALKLSCCWGYMNYFVGTLLFRGNGESVGLEETEGPDHNVEWIWTGVGTW